MDNIYFCDWSSPGSIYYLDFRLGMTYRVLDGNKIPLGGATVSVELPNATHLSLTTNSTGHVSLIPVWPGQYDVSVFWQNVLVGSFKFEEVASGMRDLQCGVFDAKLTATDSLERPLNNCTLDIQLPNGSSVVMASPAYDAGRRPQGLSLLQGLPSRRPCFD